MDLLKAVTNEQLKNEVPTLNIGDTVRVSVKIKEGNKERIQAIEGTITAKHNNGISSTFTVRRVAYGCGVERTFLVHSPNVAKVEIVRSGKVRRAKLYYLRDRVGKAARVKQKVLFEKEDKNRFLLETVFLFCHVLFCINDLISEGNMI